MAVIDMSLEENKAKHELFPLIERKERQIDSYIGELEERNLGQLIRIIGQLSDWLTDWHMEWSVEYGANIFYVKYPDTMQVMYYIRYQIRQCLSAVIRKFTVGRDI